MLTVDARRHDFPSLEGVSYFNSAAEGIPPRAVIASLAQYAQDKLLGMDGRRLHEAQYLAAKEQVAKAYGLTSDEIALCSCSSEAFNLASLALSLREDDEVIINDLDFPAGTTPFLQPTCPATVKIWRMREGALRVDDLIELLGPRTRLVTTSLVSFYNGFMIPLPEVVRAVSDHSSSLLALDVTQALGRVPLDLSGVDLVISSTHKWILASHGGGLVGVPSAKAQQWTVRAGGWFNLENPFDADRFSQAVTKPGAASFSVGMPNYPAIYAMRAALDYIHSVGIAKIDDYCRPLVRYCLDELKKMPVEIITPDEPDSLAGIVAFCHPQSERLYQALHDQNIHVMCHAGRLRVAIHGYNTQADVERLLQVLYDTVKPRSRNRAETGTGPNGT